MIIKGSTLETLEFQRAIVGKKWKKVALFLLYLSLNFSSNILGTIK